MNTGTDRTLIESVVTDGTILEQDKTINSSVNVEPSRGAENVV